MAVPVGMPDHALLTRARDGDGEAFEALYLRHHRAATRAAHSYSSRTQLAEDAVQEAFLRILRATQEGGGPQTEFRAYLATTVRHVIAGWTRGERTVASDDLEILAGEDTRDSVTPESRLRWHLLTKAFKSLPTRWQEALWLGEVEGVEPAELAERWNMTPNSAAALTYRAREGLRTAWLDAHVNEGLVPDECRPYVTDLGRYAQDKLTERRMLQVREHLEDCEHCRVVLVEVGAAALELRVLLLPIALWGGTAVAGGLAVGGILGAAKTWVGRIGQRGVAVGAGTAVAVAAVVVAVANPWAPPDDADAGDATPTVQSTDPATDPSDPPATTDPTDPATTDPATTDPADPDPDPTPDPEPTDDPTTAPPPPAQTGNPTTDPPSNPDTTPPPAPVTQPADPEPTDDPTEDPTEEPSDPVVTAPEFTVGEPDAEGDVALSGSGGVPGATVTVRTAASGGQAGERFVLPRNTLPPGQVVATTTVETDGTWTATVELRSPASGQVVEAVQTAGGVTSPASEQHRLPEFELPPPTLEIEEDGDAVRLVGTGEREARVTVRDESGETVATATVGADDTWQAELLVAHDGQTVSAIQVSHDGFTSAASAQRTLPAAEEPPEAPEAPTIVYAWVNGGGHVFAWGGAERGATVVVRVVDGEEIGRTQAARWPLPELWGMDVPNTDLSPGTMIEAVQVVDGVESPPSEPFALRSTKGHHRG